MALRRDQRPVTEEDYERVRELHAQGLSACARRRAGLASACSTFIEFQCLISSPRAVQLRKARQGDAERLTEQLWQPAIVSNFGGKENTYNELVADRASTEPPRPALMERLDGMASTWLGMAQLLMERERA
jgi:hypothetical protein